MTESPRVDNCKTLVSAKNSRETADQESVDREGMLRLLVILKLRLTEQTPFLPPHYMSCRFWLVVIETLALCMVVYGIRKQAFVDVRLDLDQEAHVEKSRSFLF
jgi:hypothetical protein